MWHPAFCEHCFCIALQAEGIKRIVPDSDAHGFSVWRFSHWHRVAEQESASATRKCNPQKIIHLTHAAFLF